jgi:TolB protein
VSARLPTALVALLVAAFPLAAQDPPTEGVRVGITYQPGVRPGLIVLGAGSAAVMDSLQAIVARDLDFSDQFELITLPSDDTLEAADPGGTTSLGFVNYRLYGALGADYAVRILPPEGERVSALVYDVRQELVRRELSVDLPPLDDPDFRLAVHRLSDEVVRAVSGAPGVAASRLVFVRESRVYRVDADGADPRPVSRSGARAFSPAWAPGGRQIAYTEFHEGGGRLYLYDLATGDRRLLPPTSESLNYASAFSPDGGTLAFTRSGEEGTDLYTWSVAGNCCLQRLTVGRFADNLSPTFSPDGRRIAYVSTRAGLPQIYVMSADGTDQELFAPFDYGVTGSSNAPEWSPDGLSLAFHRDVGGQTQIFVMDVGSRTVRQLTSAGRNEDPTWAPDGRHLAFVSHRTGSRQLWVIDLETGRVRQLTRGGEARLPAWSHRID